MELTQWLVTLGCLSCCSTDSPSPPEFSVFQPRRQHRNVTRLLCYVCIDLPKSSRPANTLPKYLPWKFTSRVRTATCNPAKVPESGEEPRWARLRKSRVAFGEFVCLGGRKSGDDERSIPVQLLIRVKVDHFPCKHRHKSYQHRLHPAAQYVDQNTAYRKACVITFYS